jgi:hypothetical protein
VSSSRRARDPPELIGPAVDALSEASRAVPPRGLHDGRPIRRLDRERVPAPPGCA